MSSMHHVGAASNRIINRNNPAKHQETQKTVIRPHRILTGLTPAAGRSASDSGTATDKTQQSAAITAETLDARATTGSGG